MNKITDKAQTITAILLIGFGGFFLLAQVTGLDFFGMAWPLIVLTPGVIFLSIALGNDDNSTVGFIYPGVVVTGTGLILAYQNFTNHWESWAYIWALYPIMVGIALRYHGYRTNNTTQTGIGRKMLIGWLIVFVLFAAIFELFIFNGVGLGILAPMIPLVMIAAGLFMLFRGQIQDKAKRKAHDM